jgi:hypothetical protein
MQDLFENRKDRVYATAIAEMSSTSTHDRLAVAMGHEVWMLLLANMAAAVHAVAFSDVRSFPNVLTVVVVA